MNDLEQLLSGGDLRSLGKSNAVIGKINTQEKFDDLFPFLFHDDRIVVMRAGDVVEKISKTNPEFLRKHKIRLLKLFGSTLNIELKWHVALIIPRLRLTNKELGSCWYKLRNWVLDKNESKIVRVNSVQALFELAQQETSLEKDLKIILQELEMENVPSINARVKKIQKKI